MEIVAVAGQKLVEQGLLGIILVLEGAAIVYLYRRVEALQREFTNHLRDEGQKLVTVVASNSEVLKDVLDGQKTASAANQAMSNSVAVLTEILRRQ